MLLAISGKIGSGKDTVGKIIQYLVADKNISYNGDSFYPTILEFINGKDIYNINYVKDYTESISQDSKWEVKKFADALKEIVCILTGCTREQLEDIDFKNSKLPDEWIRYGKANGFYSHSDNDPSHKIMDNKQCSKEEYEEELRVNWQTAYKTHFTYRDLLQQLGTNLLRNQLHEDVWSNALFSKYKPLHKQIPNFRQPDDIDDMPIEYPNWIITDCRFENEAKSIKDRDGIVIRVNRTIKPSKPFKFWFKGKEDFTQGYDAWIDERDIIHYIPTITPVAHESMFKWGTQEIIIDSNNQHISETVLDNYPFDEVIDNFGSIEELIVKVRDILLKRNII